jgi:hypothetical protein
MASVHEALALAFSWLMIVVEEGLNIRASRSLQE